MKTYLPLIFLLLSACASLPPAISQPPGYDLTYFEASQNIKKFHNAPVRWGGVIVDITNEPNRSLIQVLSYPLNSQGRPMLGQPYQGRFVISTADFLDPTVYRPDTMVTVAGTIAGEVERTIGKKTLHLPLLNIAVLHLWLDNSSDVYSNYNTFNPSFAYPGWSFYQPPLTPMR